MHARRRKPEPVAAGRGSLGLTAAAIAYAADQLHKWWMLHVYDIGARGKVTLTPFLDLVLSWNSGISYGLFQQDSDAGRYVLIAVAVAIVAVLVVWLFRTTDRLVALAIGLIVGGALGNVTDRYLYGAVADFISLHAFGFRWYVFNLADVAVVAGVSLLLYDSFAGARETSGESGDRRPRP